MAYHCFIVQIGYTTGSRVAVGRMKEETTRLTRLHFSHSSKHPSLGHEWRCLWTPESIEMQPITLTLHAVHATFNEPFWLYSKPLALFVTQSHNL